MRHFNRKKGPRICILSFICCKTALILSSSLLNIIPVLGDDAFVDLFEGPALNPGWVKENVKNCNGFKYNKPLKGALEITDIIDSNSATQNSVVYRMTHSFKEIHGDFTAILEINWNQMGIASMTSVRIELLSPDGIVMASGGLRDSWLSGYARMCASIGEKEHLGQAVPDRGFGTLRIERVKDEYVIKFKNMTINSGTGSNRNVGFVRLSIEYIDYPNYKNLKESHFGHFSIKKIAISPGVQTPPKAKAWTVGTPIVTYWAGPKMTDALAKQLADGNWNLVYCRTVWELDLIHKYGLRGIIVNNLLKTNSLDMPKTKEKLDLFLDSVKNHPALYAYYFKDEPNASTFPFYARIKNYVQKKDPAHLGYFNLYPVVAGNKKLGVTGDEIPAYKEYMRQFIDIIKPQLLSYDHYTFSHKGDSKTYFLNQKLIRDAALKAGIPSMNILQACSWTINMRIPTGEELLWLANTSLAYGAQGISWYVLGHRGHDGGMISLADGSPTLLYYAAKEVNRKFVAVATELQSLRSINVYHAGMLPGGTIPLPATAPFRIAPCLSSKEYVNLKPVEGFIVSYFGKKDIPTHAFFVNLDYRTYSGIGDPRSKEFNNPVAREVVGPGPLEVFNAKTGKWFSTKGNRVKLRLPPGGGVLVRVSEKEKKR